jgi:hypothetical protein
MLCVDGKKVQSCLVGVHVGVHIRNLVFQSQAKSVVLREDEMDFSADANNFMCIDECGTGVCIHNKFILIPSAGES